MFRPGGNLTPRRVLVFAQHAATWEPTSRLRAAILGPEHYGWGRPESLTADVWDALWSITYARSGARGDAPRYPRPGAKTHPRAARSISVAQVAQITGRR